MQKREQYKRLLIFTISAVIVGLLTGIFAHVWYTCYAYERDVMAQGLLRQGSFVLIGLYAMLMFMFFKLYGGFRVGYLRTFDVLSNQILSVLCVNAVAYLQLWLIGRWDFPQNIWPILVMTAADIAVVTVWVFVSRGVYLWVYPPRELLLVGGRHNTGALRAKISSREDQYIVQETISYLEPLEKIRERISHYEGVILGDIPSRERNALLKYCYDQNIRCYSVPKISDILIRGGEIIDLFDTTLLLHRNMGVPVEYRFIKRLIDIVGALLGIVLTSPLMLVIAACIKLYDGGPVFFAQERLTEGNRVFHIYKFRSMRVEDEREEYCMTRKNDERVTPVGRILRDSHLDELPQFFNILKGDMSLVGPRPECPELAAKYTQSIPEFPFRLKVKAGLTGYAQVYGKYNTTPYDKLKLDLTYIENYSLRMDLKLILLTVRVLFQRESENGIESWQNAASLREDEENEATIEK